MNDSGNDNSDHSVHDSNNTNASGGSFDRNYNTSGNPTVSGGSAPAAAAAASPAALADTPTAAQAITNILNNYSYYTIDDRDVITDQSVNQSITALGDVNQTFDNHSVLAAGAGAVAAGGNIDGTITTGSGNVLGNGFIGDGNIVGNDNAVGNTSIRDSVVGDGNVAQNAGTVVGNDNIVGNDGDVAYGTGNLQDNDGSLLGGAGRRDQRGGRQRERHRQRRRLVQRQLR